LTTSGSFEDERELSFDGMVTNVRFDVAALVGRRASHLAGGSIAGFFGIAA
jgi:hypothetical protein